MYAKEPQNEPDFFAQRRDVMFDFKNYTQNTADIIENFDLMTSKFLAERAKAPDCTPADLMASSSAKARDAINYLHLQYTAGVPLAHLRDFYPLALEYWEEYAKYHVAFHATPESSHIVAHMPLAEAWFWDALRMTCFGILLGHTNELHRLCTLWDYGNPQMDGLLERLVAPYVPGRAAPRDECNNHLPYFKTLKIFAAEPAKRPAMMARYLDEWYTASRREPYYESHTDGRSHNYLGYWSFEAAAITLMLNIDDSSYRDKEFYPKDLADYARTLRDEGVALPGPDHGRLRGLPKEIIPKTGWWWSPARPNGQAEYYFEAGQHFPDTALTNYGDVIWYFDPNLQKEAPKN